MEHRTGDRADKLASAHADLVAAVESLTSGEDWQRMLELASRFHHYSANNVFLIMLQRPEATRVAGYKTWQSLGRQVRKGEKGLVILAPCKYRYDVEREDGTTDKVVGIRGFTTAHVFDVSQTDGAELPDCGPSMLQGEGVEGLWEALARQVQDAGYELAVSWSPEASAQLLGRANGATRHPDRSVTIAYGLSPAQRAKTLAHELAHVLLHPDTGEYFQCRGRCEVEAESVAYLVCRAAGMASDGYSFPYIANWADGKTETVQATAGRVLEAACQILAGVEAGQQLAVA